MYEFAVELVTLSPTTLTELPQENYPKIPVTGKVAGVAIKEGIADIPVINSITETAVVEENDDLDDATAKLSHSGVTGIEVTEEDESFRAVECIHDDFHPILEIPANAPSKDAKTNSSYCPCCNEHQYAKHKPTHRLPCRRNERPLRSNIWPIISRRPSLKQNALQRVLNLEF